jgi:hypothetical protein
MLGETLRNYNSQISIVHVQYFFITKQKRMTVITYIISNIVIGRALYDNRTVY